MLLDKLTEEHKKINLEVDRHINRIISAEAADLAAALAAQNKFEEARTLLTTAISKVNESPSAKEELSTTLVSEMQTCLGQMQNRSVYQQQGQYNINGFSKAMYAQRCNVAKPQAQAPMPYASASTPSFGYGPPGGASYGYPAAPPTSLYGAPSPNPFNQPNVAFGAPPSNPTQA